MKTILKNLFGCAGSCDTQDLLFLLRREGSLVSACGTWSSDQGLNLGLLGREHSLSHWSTSKSLVFESLQEKGATEDEAVGWNHRLNRHEFDEVPSSAESLPFPFLPAQLGVQRQGTWSLPTVDSGPCRAVGSYQQASPHRLDGHVGLGPGVSDPALQGPDVGPSCSWPAANPGRPGLPHSPGPDAGVGVHLSRPTLPHQCRGVASP